jgi:glycosyltransferase involved in cell wall biosynthesis
MSNKAQCILVIGGYTRSLINFRGSLLRAMVQLGHHVHACAPEDDPVIARRLAGMSVTFHAVRLRRASLSPAADLLYLRDLAALVRRIRPDMVFAYTHKPVIFGSMAARLGRVPATVSMITGLGYAFGSGDSLKQSLAGSAVRALYRRVLPWQKTVFFQNVDDRDLFVNRGILPRSVPAVVLNGSGVDLEHFRPAPPVLDPLRFLLIARLLREKGIEEYAEAARRVRARHPRTQFELVGPFDPNPSGLAEETVLGWHRDGVLHYHGETDDVRPFLANASVYVLPSYREGRPRTVLEAMAMARPIITTDAPGCRDAIEPDRNGFLVPPRDPSALADAMERFVLDPSLVSSMGAESRDVAVERYDVNDVNRIILQQMGLLPGT